MLAGYCTEGKRFVFWLFLSKARSEEKHTKPPTTKSTATASVGVESLTEPASEGNEPPADSGDPARSVRVAAPSSRNRVSSASRGKGQSIDPDGTEACRARFLDGATSLEEALRVVRSGTEGDTVSVRAYSFDQPDLVRALVGASEAGSGTPSLRP